MVMFNLLNLLIDYTNRIAGATDMLAGENPGQNTPAETARTMVEQGEKIYSAIFKRVWRSLKLEFKKYYTLNALYLPMTSSFGEGEEVRREDYSVSAASVIPVADPTITSDAARFAQATLVREAAAGNPGYDNDEVERRYLATIGIDDVDKIYPGVDPQNPPAPDIKIQIQQLKNEQAAAELAQSKMEFMITMQETARVNSAKIQQLTQQAMLMEKQASTLEGKQQVEAFRAGIEAMREQNNQTNTALDRMMESFNESRKANAGTVGALPSLETAPSDQAPIPMGGAPQGSPEGIMG
jgi:outer membrane murein-binding lipoprotein Lpp